MATLYANPYDITANGFYFVGPEEFAQKVAAHRCEEFEIQFIDGDDTECALAKAMGSGLNQASIDQFFEFLDEELQDYELAAVLYQVENLHSSLEEAMDNRDDYNPVWSAGTLECFSDQQLMKDYLMSEEADYLLEGMPEHLQGYFDWDAYARDSLHSYTAWEFSFGWFLFTQ